MPAPHAWECHRHAMDRLTIDHAPAGTQGIAVAAAIVALCLVAAGANRSGTYSASVVGGGVTPVLVLAGVAGALLALGGVVMIVYAMSPRQRRYAAAATALLVALVVVAALFSSPNSSRSSPPPPSAAPPTVSAPAASPTSSTPADQSRGAHGDWWAVGIALGAAILVAGLVIGRRPQPTLPEDNDADEIPGPPVAPIGDWRAALEAEPDARRAVIAAYDVMERRLALSGAGRAAWEAPYEYRDRLVAQFGSDARPAPTLTDLFVRARFSEQPVDDAMKQSAIHALDRLSINAQNPS